MKLNRSFNQRKALTRSQANAFIANGHITTTQSKAKMLKPIVEKMIAKAKTNSVHVRRQLASELANVASANRLVDVIAPLYIDVASGFVTNSKVKIRLGDATTMVTLKLTRDLPVEVKPEKVKKVKPEVKSKPTKEKKAEKKVSTKKK